ncbi:MAG: hypothetical protein ACPL1F_05645, partial [bacterium]
MKIKEKGGIMIILSLFLIVFFTFIMLLQIKYFSAYWKVMREAVDLETYGDPLAWQIRSELYIINEVAKGTLITNDKKILDLLEVKLDNLDNEFKPVNFQIDNQLQVRANFN